MTHFETISVPGAAPIQAWIKGVPLEDAARSQLLNAARMPFVHHHVAVMPDVHMGIGATVGSVIPTVGAIIPAAVGVDIGCGMCAVRTSLTAADLPESLAAVRAAIEKAVPHGRSDNGGLRDRGSWGSAPAAAITTFKEHLHAGLEAVLAKHPVLRKDGDSVKRSAAHLGTLGTGNHFIEVCLDEEDRVWFMLHSGSRGIGNRFGEYFIGLARDDCRRAGVDLADRDLAYFTEGTEHFSDYIQAVGWAQDYARHNRRLMLEQVIAAVSGAKGIPPFTCTVEAVNCHHNYVAQEQHFGKECWVTRKGAVRAGAGEMGIIPGSMGARSYIVRGKGNPESFCSCSHGAGRVMSRTKAKQRFTVADHIAATAGVECRKDADVIDETPMAYKDIDAVMAAQSDLVEIVHTLKQVVCVKG
jgi:tRNA-splicing ligase RtcB